MTMDRTLKTHGGLTGSRSVLSRTERIARLIDEGKFDPALNSPLGLPKVRVRHSKAGTKTKKAEEPAAATVEGAAPVEGAAAAKAPAEGVAKGPAPKAAPAKAAPARAASTKTESKPGARGVRR